MSESRTVKKKPELNQTAPLTISEPYQRQNSAFSGGGPRSPKHKQDAPAAIH